MVSGDKAGKSPSAREPGRSETTGNLRQRAVQAMGGTAFVVAIDRLVQVIFLIVLARLLSPHETGVAVAVGAVVGMINLLISMGIPACLIQAPIVTPALQATARGVLLIAAVTGLILAEAFSFQIGRWYHNVNVAGALAVAAPIVLAQPLAMVAYASLARQLRARDLALADLASNLLGAALVTVPLAILQRSYWALVFGFMAQLALKAVLLVFFARMPITVRLEPRLAASLCRQGMAYLSNGGFSRLIVLTPGIIIGRLMPGAALGIFNRANSLMTYPTGLFSAVVERVAFPAISLVQDDPARLRAGVLDGVRILSIVGIPLTVAFVLLGADIISLLLGPQWLRAIAPFSILGIAAYFRLGDRLAWLTLRAIGKPATLALIQLVVLIVLIAACLIGAQDGLVGVAWAVVASSALSYLLVSVAAMRSAGVKLRDWVVAHGHGLACGALAVAVLGPLTILLHRLDVASAVVITGSLLASGLAALCAVQIAPKVFLGEAGRQMVRTVVQNGRGRWLRSR